MLIDTVLINFPGVELLLNSKNSQLNVMLPCVMMSAVVCGGSSRVMLLCSDVRLCHVLLCS